MPLRIAVWHDPPSGGAQRSLSEMLSRLQQRGHAIDIFRLGEAHHDATSEQASNRPVNAAILTGD